jgi:hypothetical protein
MLGGQSTINFRTVLDRQLILLVNVPKGILGEGASALLAGFIVAQLQKAALSRADIPEHIRRQTPYFLYLDEFQNYTTDNVRDILSESRKYSFSLTLAHQYLAQLSPELQSAILNTAGTISAFRVGYHDGFQLAKEIFPSPDFLLGSRQKVRVRKLWGVPYLSVREGAQSCRWDEAAQAISSLPRRQFWVRRRGPHPPVKLRTLTMPEVADTRELRALVTVTQDGAGARYGRLKRDVRRELEAKAGRDQPSRRPMRPADIKGGPETVPFWSE